MEMFIALRILMAKLKGQSKSNWHVAESLINGHHDDNVFDFDFDSKHKHRITKTPWFLVRFSNMIIASSIITTSDFLKFVNQGDYFTTLVLRF